MMKNLNFPGLPRVLVVDDEEHVRESLRGLLQAEGVAVETVEGLDAAVRRVERRAFDVVIVDQHLRGSSGTADLAGLRRGEHPADLVVLAGYGTAADVVDLMRKGATDVVEKPVQRGRLLGVIRRCLELRQLRNELAWSQERVRELAATELLGLSARARELQERIDDVAQSPDTTVLITGESGTGKELVARCIHAESVRRHGPFIAVNCAAFSENVLEAELFGYESGAFAGASRQGQDGRFAQAAGGTLFLDEIGEISTSLQAKLLRVLQERTFRRVGGSQDLAADVRIVASTRLDLRREVAAGHFREDLFYRLDVMGIDVPPLRQRAQDIPLLAHFFLDQIARQMGKGLTGFTEEATEVLCEHDWPGNVRELRNAVERAAIACPAGMIDECHLPKFTGGLMDGSDEIPRNVFVLDGDDCSLRALEGQLVAKVLDATSWNVSRAASMLGINRTTLYNKIRLHGLGERPKRDQVSFG